MSQEMISPIENREDPLPIVAHNITEIHTAPWVCCKHAAPTVPDRHLAMVDHALLRASAQDVEVLCDARRLVRKQFKDNPHGAIHGALKPCNALRLGQHLPVGGWIDCRHRNVKEDNRVRGMQQRARKHRHS